ncbi:hypothetical protein AMTRI_Chr06g198920 [Amborella trichopoda]
MIFLGTPLLQSTVCNTKKMHVRELLKLCETITSFFVQRTNNPLWVISDDLERNILC